MHFSRAQNIPVSTIWGVGIIENNYISNFFDFISNFFLKFPFGKIYSSYI